VRTFAVLPVKSFSHAKQRLSAGVGPGERRELAAAMVGDVLETLAAARLDGVVVVTAEPLAESEARAAGAQVIPDPAEAGQSAAVSLGVSAALAGGAERVLLVPGDCPALLAEDVDALLDRADRNPMPAHPLVVIVPDRHRTGTNALLLSPPEAIAPAFGPGSFARHAALARAAGAEMDVADVPSLGHDVDTPSDLVALRALLAARRRGAPRTRAVLDRLAPALEAAG
jgi:2-phospho-L-lactate guanylyltransferase